MHCNKLNQALDSKVGERHYAILTDPEDPDHAVLDFHFAGDVEQPVSLSPRSSATRLIVVTWWTLLTYMDQAA